MILYSCASDDCINLLKYISATGRDGKRGEANMKLILGSQRDGVFPSREEEKRVIQKPDLKSYFGKMQIILWKSAQTWLFCLLFSLRRLLFLA